MDFFMIRAMNRLKILLISVLTLFASSTMMGAKGIADDNSEGKAMTDVQSDSVGKPLYLGLKTNLLFDIILVPNISLEWAFAPRWSISAEYMHAWWKSDASHKYWRTYGGNAELRYWFGKKAVHKRLAGHHVGIYGGALTYDFEWGGKGYQAHKWSTNFGISYGYSAPIARRLNLDFEIGLGYLSGEYEEYEPKGDHYYWQATKNRKFFGPTRAEVTLVWLLGKDNMNKK